LKPSRIASFSYRPAFRAARQLAPIGAIFSSAGTLFIGELVTFLRLIFVSFLLLFLLLLFHPLRGLADVQQL
jgi:hypothetical protein